MDTLIHGQTDALMDRYTDEQMDTLIHGHTGSLMHGHADTRTH